jgi:hypothetical protein
MALGLKEAFRSKQRSASQVNTPPDTVRFLIPGLGLGSWIRFIEAHSHRYDSVT